MALTSPFLPQPKYIQPKVFAAAAPIVLPSEPPVLIPEPITKLELEPYPYLPMGSVQSLYEPRNCTWGAASMKPTVPNNWGNAAEWAGHALAEGYTVSNIPIVGAVGQHGGGYGHVVVVVGVSGNQVEVTEMNYDWNGGVRTVWVPVSTYQYIYI